MNNPSLTGMVSLAAALALGISAAHAQTAAPTAPSTPPSGVSTSPPVDPPTETSPFSANVALTTKYKFRGQDQGNTKWFSPALQGGFDFSKNGFYVGNWNSNVNFSNAAIEMDFYGGYKGEFVPDLGYDVGALQYYYPQKDRDFNFNTTEVYGALSYKWASFKYSHTVSKDYFGIGEIQQEVGGAPNRPKGRNTGYYDASANIPLPADFVVNLHLGYTRLSKQLRHADDGFGTDLGVKSFYDYKAGMSWGFGTGFTLAAAYVGANKKGFYGDLNKGRGILTLSKSM